MGKSLVSEVNTAKVDIGCELAENFVGRILVQEAIDQLARLDWSLTLYQCAVNLPTPYVSSSSTGGPALVPAGPIIPMKTLVGLALALPFVSRLTFLIPA